MSPRTGALSLLPKFKELVKSATDLEKIPPNPDYAPTFFKLLMDFSNPEDKQEVLDFFDLLADDSVSTPFTKMLVIASFTLTAQEDVENQAKVYKNNKKDFSDRLRNFIIRWIKSRELKNIHPGYRSDHPMRFIRKAVKVFNYTQRQRFFLTLEKIILSFEALLTK